MAAATVDLPTPPLPTTSCKRFDAIKAALFALATGVNSALRWTRATADVTVAAVVGTWKALRGWSALLVACVFCGCGPPTPLSERDLYDGANAEFEATNFDTATTFYEEMLEQYPFSDLAEGARLRIAHAYYLNGDYEKAIAAFNDFERLHPTSAQLAFVEYSIGMSYLDQARTRDRDNSASENALQQFQRVRDNYPGSLYGRLADFRISQCTEKLASHELYVGDYYARSGKDRAARARYRYILATYPNSDAALGARERLASMEPETEQTDEEVDAAEAAEAAKANEADPP
jgi:outer membrane protein assembly factor BamD